MIEPYLEHSALAPQAAMSTIPELHDLQAGISVSATFLKVVTVPLKSQVALLRLKFDIFHVPIDPSKQTFAERTLFPYL